ncbi:MAG: FAD-dependent oxidoreductase [Verrucomicrobiales bacterium]|nr:FAD-dependent oxidoreductase [Verrucomicrobiales bacterium]
MMPRSPLVTALALLFSALVPRASAAPETVDADVCVYGATPSGILAAIAVRRAGHSVVIIEPSRWVGGMLGAGLKPLQDCPNFNATGGLTHELLPQLGTGAPRLVEAARGSLDPSAIRRDFQNLLDQHHLRVIHDHRIASIEKNGTTLLAATFDRAPFDPLGCPVAQPEIAAALRVTARVFIDASYEGDLMPAAGVPSRVGRESSAEYGEELAGVREPMEQAEIDPFVTPGDPQSGLLPWVEDDDGLPLGSADGNTQAYNYRYYTTSDPAHRAPLTPPADYNASEFELVGRYIAHLTATTPDADTLRQRLVGIFPGWKNSGEWNYQRSSLFSMAPLGISQLYAAGDAAEKARVWKAHQNYLRGLHHFMSTDPRVPAAYRQEMAALGLDLRAHPDTAGWPHQLYIRVARRLQGRYTVTAADVYNRTQIDDPIALAQYGIDTYPARRLWGRDENGKTWVAIEGKMFVGGSKGPTNQPYPIPYRAITPQAEHATNLLVPVCFSASHLGYASARMEPVFMICGQSAGIAAVRALEENTTVQDIDATAFQAALLAAHQKLTWDPATDIAPGADRYQFDHLLRQADANADGSISQAEWDTAKNGWEWLFEKIDTDANGQLSQAEYAAFQTLKQQDPDWAKTLR